jgi:phosphoserine phosphatase
MSGPPTSDAPAVGCCLDVDGTLHRSGSVFVETLAFLGYGDTLALDAEARRYRREVIGAVAEYDGGPAKRRRWEWALKVLDALAQVGGKRLAGATLSGLARLHDARSEDRLPETAADGGRARHGEYRAMQRRVLDAYGNLLAGMDQETVERAARDAVERHVGVDLCVERAIAVARAEADAEVFLVTDAPVHAARAYADVLFGEPDNAIGTRFAVDDAGRFTGEYELVDKGRAAERLRAERGWEFVVAAGDSAVDLRMASAADAFLAVDGEGDVERALDDPTAAVDLPESCRVYRVGRGESVGPSLLQALADRGLVQTEDAS